MHQGQLSSCPGFVCSQTNLTCGCMQVALTGKQLSRCQANALVQTAAWARTSSCALVTLMYRVPH